MRPRSPEPTGAALRADLAACAALLRQGSKTFHAASRLLPSGVRDPAVALYSFCRLADDAVDTGGGTAALESLRQRLADAYAGRPAPEPADRAFAWAVAAFEIPAALPEALLEGFAWDADGRRYETLADLEAYAARVAGSVGAMMSVLMDARQPEVLARACDLGIAMQLTNIARDVGEDARLGRVYLPLTWMREAGLDPEAWLAKPVFSPDLAAVIARVLEAAEQLYVRSSAGIAELPASCRPGMHAARLLYAEIGREVQRRGLDAVSQRAVVPPARKAALLPAVMMAAATTPAATGPVGALEAARFLVEAAARQPAGPLPAAGHRAHRFEERVVWLLGLFERLERRERQLRERMTPSPQS
jgi:15-cis-phytoene synthase